MKTMFYTLGSSLIVLVMVFGEMPKQQWDPLKLPNGTEYKEAKLLSVEADGIKIQHANGVALIPHEKLPAELQERFPLDPEKAKAAKKRKADEQRLQIAKQRQADAKARAAVVDYGSVKFEIVNIKVVRVEPDGIICHRYEPAGVAGETARAVNGLLDNPRRFREPNQKVTVDAPSSVTLWFLEGCKEKCAEGDVLVGYAGRYGEKEWQGRTLQRWIAKPN